VAAFKVSRHPLHGGLTRVDLHGTKELQLQFSPFFFLFSISKGVGLEKLQNGS
jgi:hypothetical protein